MKKSGFWGIIGMAAVAAMVCGFLAGCSSIPALNKSYMGSADITTGGYAVLYIEGDKISSFAVDTEPRDKLFMKNIKNQLILLPPGEHTVGAIYYIPEDRGYTSYGPAFQPGVTVVRQGFTTIGGNIRGSPTFSNPVAVKHNFEAGHYYYFDADPETNEFYLVDETDPSSVWESEYRIKETEKRKTATKKKLGAP
jgi:hypothetical protein